MDRWAGRVALVTGASAGIGAAIAKELVLQGMKVVGVGRRVDKIEELSSELQGGPGKLFALSCDVSKESDVLATFEWITATLGGVDVLVNNAGNFREATLFDGSTEAWRQTLDVNVLGLSVCTREAIKSMRARGVDDGHVVHINSIWGHTVPAMDFEGAGMYTASKFAVTALTEALRKELVHLKSRIRVTCISPGEVKTDIIDAAGLADKYSTYYDTTPHLQAKDIADAVVYVLGVPAHVQIHELTIKPIGELA